MKYLAVAISLLTLLLPAASSSAEIQRLLDQVKFDLKFRPSEINVKFKDVDVIGKSEKWCYLVAVTNKTDQPRSFAAEINIYDDRGIVIHTVGNIHIYNIAPNSEEQVMDEVFFSEDLTSEAMEIRISGQGFY